MPPPPRPPASGGQGASGAPPAPPRRSRASREEDESVRDVPCNRCIRQMADWKPAMTAAFSANLPRCVETQTASNKCTRCANMKGKTCVPATRATTMAGIELRRLFEELNRAADPSRAYPDVVDEINKAQVAGKKALQKQTNLAKVPDAKRKAEAEEEEWLLRQRSVAAAEASADAARRQAKSAESLAKSAKVATMALEAHTTALREQTAAIVAQTSLLSEWSQTYSQVHAGDLDSAAGDATAAGESEGQEENDGESEDADEE
ncbi:hypothetical protein CSUB01_01756 [Colletotrichum sublineola]|uniref:Uncharacterized protein n=1 Tax=Colletotrichum sublineola TaxID=1173701 RepID=A0A066XD61_COLSU|nr:hypothetical protein CSUB01_01756 [Colletotrichum sublineola]